MHFERYTGHRAWRLEDIAFDKIDKASVRDDEFLFLTLASASFVEILAEKYGENLIDRFRGDADITGWLGDFWQREEAQHGQAIKMYVQTVWPEFDWEKAYRAFLEEYVSLCTVERLEPDKALELIARCVVETGTSSFYRALRHYAHEPVLRQLIGHIKADEIAHYTRFRLHFNAYNAVACHGVGAVIAAIWRRLMSIRGEDAYIAFKHVYTGRHPDQPFREKDWRSFNRSVKRLARRHYPYSMAVKMLIKPIPLHGSIKRLLKWPLLGLAVMVSIV
jgi:rubrerythrin